jgi:hypothetical protein
MGCENPNCHCQSEVGLMKDGRQFCSEHCLKEGASEGDVCRCGHAGCSTADELERAEPEAVRA